jgi:serine/threonine-protein kinase
LDFGIAKQMSVDWTSRTVMTSKSSHLTLTGTIQYMSPEQALVQEVDTRSDIFSIGVVLYEMLTGRRPFSGPTLTAVIDQIVKVTPPCIGDLVPNIPPAVQRIVSKCLEKRPEQRYQTAERLREDLKLTARTSTLDMERRVKSSAPSMSSAKTIPDTTHAKELV